MTNPTRGTQMSSESPASQTPHIDSGRMHLANNSGSHTRISEYAQCEITGLQIFTKYRTIFPFERDFDYHSRQLWGQENWTLSLYAVAIYLSLIVLGQRMMRSRPAFDLRRPLFLWNLCLSLLSIGGALRITPEMVYLVREFGFTYSVCSMGAHQHMQAVGLWVWLFAWSKLWELGDTAFIVLRKKNLIFLHWYHHITVLTGVWFGCGYINSMGRWFMACNYFVHAFMYSYYALKSLRIKVPKAVSIALTVAQILQMVTCIYVTFYVYLVKSNGEHCCTTYRALAIGVCMYATYFLLFLNFFLRAYVFTGKRADAKKDGDKTLSKKVD